jgi:hypothetical protein
VWESYIKVDLIGIVYEGVNWTQLAKNRVQISCERSYETWVP